MSESVMLSNVKAVFLENPDPDVFDIEAIANSLSKIPRFCGNTFGTWSVAAHCVLATYYCDDRFKLETLLHDAAEIVISDIPSPVKAYLHRKTVNGDGTMSVLQELENRILKAVYKKHNAVWSDESLACVHEADQKAGLIEGKLFMPSKWIETYADGPLPEFPPPEIWCPMVNMPEVSMKTFLETYEKLRRDKK